MPCPAQPLDPRSTVRNPSEHSPVEAETTKQVTLGQFAALQNCPMSSRTAAVANGGRPFCDSSANAL